MSERYDISLTAESSDGQQNVDYSGALKGGYDAARSKNLRRETARNRQRRQPGMTIGSLGFPTGQACSTGSKSTNQPFNATKVTQ